MKIHVMTLTSCSDPDEEITGDASDLLTYILDSMEALAIELQNDPSLTSQLECLANQLIGLSADLKSGDLEPPSDVDALLNRTQDLQEELADSLSEARSDLQEVVSAMEAKEAEVEAQEGEIESLQGGSPEENTDGGGDDGADNSQPESSPDLLPEPTESATEMSLESVESVTESVVILIETTELLVGSTELPMGSTELFIGSTESAAGTSTDTATTEAPVDLTEMELALNETQEELEETEAVLEQQGQQYANLTQERQLLDQALNETSESTQALEELNEALEGGRRHRRRRDASDNFTLPYCPEGEDISGTVLAMIQTAVGDGVSSCLTQFIRLLKDKIVAGDVSISEEDKQRARNATSEGLAKREEELAEIQATKEKVVEKLRNVTENIAKLQERKEVLQKEIQEKKEKIEKVREEEEEEEEEASEEEDRPSTVGVPFETAAEGLETSPDAPELPPASETGLIEMIEITSEVPLFFAPETTDVEPHEGPTEIPETESVVVPVSFLPDKGQTDIKLLLNVTDDETNTTAGVFVAINFTDALSHDFGGGGEVTVDVRAQMEGRNGTETVSGFFAIPVDDELHEATPFPVAASKHVHAEVLSLTRDPHTNAVSFRFLVSVTHAGVTITFSMEVVLVLKDDQPGTATMSSVTVEESA
ncbi:rootletin-like isoform X2 [Penaeus indicus]|uniref:rootletin-like isoform X2 n=1 Tax=Penaeus indicus TaxID=29960 RepID=UPI00300CB9D0